MNPRHHPISVVLHWLLALGIVGTLGTGLYMVGLPFSMARLKLYNWHKWAGITILVLSAARLLLRLAHKPPPAPAMPAWQAQLARATHSLLYVIFFAAPLTGWAMSSAKGFPVVWFGAIPLPDLAPKNQALGNLLQSAHLWLTYTLAALVLAHVAGVLKHQLIDRDDLLARMSLRRSRTKQDN